MKSKSLRLATISTLGIAAIVAFGSVSPAQAEVADPGIDVNHDGPNYDITIHCNTLPYNGQESYTGATQRGSYTIHADDVCVNGDGNVTYWMQWGDNGDTDENGGIKVNGVLETSTEYIPIPATFTLLPDTYVTIRYKVDGNWDPTYYNIRYNGSDPNQTATPTPEPEAQTTGLAATGSDVTWLALVGGLFGLSGSIAVAFSRRKKVSR